MNTKKSIIISAVFVSFLLISAIPGLSQDGLMERMAFGVKAGVNSSNVYDTEGEEFEADAKWGLAAGAFLSIPFGPVFGFQPEILYSQKGYKSSGSILIANYTFTRKLNYIDIPLQLQIKPIPAITILAGPQYSFLINQGYEVESGDLDLGDMVEGDDDVRKNTLGIVGGLDFHMTNIVLSGRVAWDLQRNDSDGSSTSPRYKNMVIQLTLGLMF